MEVRKPWGIYVVAIAFLMTFGGLIASLLFVVLSTDSLSTAQELAIQITALVIIFSIAFGLIQLSKFFRVLAVVLFGLIAFYQGVYVLAEIKSSDFSLMFLLLKLHFVIPSIASIMYLVRPSFKQKCQDYLKYKKVLVAGEKTVQS